MKKICLTLIALCMNFNLSADEIPLENVITIDNPTHLGLPFLALSANEGVKSDEHVKIDLDALLTWRTGQICRLMGHGAPTGSALKGLKAYSQLLSVDKKLNINPHYYPILERSYNRRYFFTTKFSKISCTRLIKKDAVKEAEATKEKIQKLLAEIKDLEKKIKSANQRVNQSSRSTASVKKESDVKQNSTGSSVKRM